MHTQWSDGSGSIEEMAEAAPHVDTNTLQLPTDPRRLSRRVCFPADCAFRGERVVFACGYTPFAGRVVAGPPLRAPCGPDLLTRLADQWPGMGAMPGERPRKAASRSLGPAVAATATGAANSGCQPGAGTSTGAIASRPMARARGIGWRCPHAREMSHPWTATSRAAAAAMTLAASGQPAMSTIWRWWLRAGPGVQQLAGTIAERPGRVSCQVPVLRGRVQPDASGFDALTERGQGFAGVPEQHPQVPFPAWRRARQDLRRDGQDHAERVTDRRFKQPGTIGRPCRPGRRGHRPGTGTAAAGTVCGRSNVANRPGSLNEVTRLTRDSAMVSTHIEWARYPPSWPRM